MNNRVVANGTPLDHSLDNVARVGLRAGYHPVMWGYTDQGADLRRIDDDSVESLVMRRRSGGVDESSGAAAPGAAKQE